MKRVPYTQFGKTKMVPLKTYTNGVKDEPPRSDYTKTMWVERGEDMYGLMSPQYKKTTVLVVNREDFLRAKEQDK